MSERKFDSGAVRSLDAEHVAFYLVSPIALEQVAMVAAHCYLDYRQLTSLRHLSYSIQFQNKYLSGNRDNPYLSWALWHGMSAVDKLNNHFLPQIDITDPDKVYYELIPPYGWQSIARAYAEGAIKYLPYNCEKGFPIYDLLNHSLNHQDLHLMGDTTENHLGHSNWNIGMAIHSEILWPNLNQDTLRRPGCLPPDANLKYSYDASSIKNYVETKRSALASKL